MLCRQTMDTLAAASSSMILCRICDNLLNIRKDIRIPFTYLLKIFVNLFIFIFDICVDINVNKDTICEDILIIDMRHACFGER